MAERVAKYWLQQDEDENNVDANIGWPLQILFGLFAKAAQLNRDSPTYTPRRISNRYVLNA